MRKLSIIAIIFSVCGVSFGQQKAQFSQYMQNQYILNPAVGGTEDFVDAKVGFRAQWLGLEGSPTTYYFSIHAPVGKEFGPSHGHHKGEHKGWHGIGMYAYNDVTGSTGRSGALFSYAYDLPLGKHLRMSIGAFGGFQNFRVDGTEFVLYDQNDNILNGVKSAFVPDMIIGTWLYNKYFFAGIAAHQLLRNRLDFQDVLNVTEESALTNHMFMTVGTNVPVGWDWNVIPSMMIKYVNPAAPSVDINAKAAYDKGKYWFGGSYRVGDSFIGIVGTTIKYRLAVSYSFDLTHTDLAPHAPGGSHEVVVTYKIPPHPQGVCPSKFWH